MNEQQLKDRLADLVVDQPAMRQGSHDDLRAGRARLRRRRGGLVAGASVLAVAAVVVAAQAPWQGGATVGRTTPVPIASGAADPASVVIERCTRTDNGALDATTFGAGSRVLTMETSSGGDVNAVILSSDGRTWGSCWLSGRSTTEFNGFRLDLLASFEPTPGTVAFLGYGSSLESDAEFNWSRLQRVNDGFFVKLAYQVRR